MRKAIVLLLLLLSIQRVEAQTMKLPEYKRIVLSNGIILLLMEQHEIPVVNLHAVIKAGNAYDSKPGIAWFTNALLRKGTAKRTAEQFATDLDFIGARLQLSTNNDFSLVSLEVLSKDRALGLEMFKEALQSPKFEPTEFEKLKNQRKGQYRGIKDNPLEAINHYFDRFLYGNHPYGKVADEVSIDQITLEDVKRYYEDYYGPEHLILAVVGDYDSAEMEKSLREAFEGWKKSVKPLASIPEPAKIKGRRMLFIDKPDTVQTFYKFGQVGIERGHPDSHIIDVVNTIFGGRFTSMLNSELRVKTGLTYGAYSNFVRSRKAGSFSIFSYTQNANTERAFDLTFNTLKELRDKGLTEEHLKSAKTYIKGQYALQFETTAQLAAQITALEFYGQDRSEVDLYFPRIDAVTLADTRRIISRYFSSDDLVLVVIGRGEDTRRLMQKYAPQITDVKIEATGFGK